MSNFRDAGGAPTTDGGVVRTGVLYRSATLAEVTPDELATLAGLGIRTVLDLRRTEEVATYGRIPDADGRRYLNVPPIHQPWDATLVYDEAAGPARYLADRYLELARHGIEGYGRMLRVLAEPGATPAIVHCYAGKDRTGVLVAMVLDAVGVERDAVVEDYVLSATQVEAIFRRRAEVLGEEMPDDIDVHKPRAEVMTAVLDHLDAGYARVPGGVGADGGAAGWLRANGLTDADLARLREHLVEPS